MVDFALFSLFTIFPLAFSLHSIARNFHNDSNSAFFPHLIFIFLSLLFLDITFLIYFRLFSLIYLCSSLCSIVASSSSSQVFFFLFVYINFTLRLLIASSSLINSLISTLSLIFTYLLLYIYLFIYLIHYIFESSVVPFSVIKA